MHAIQIRNVSDELYNKLKNASQGNHRSIAGEALSILEQRLSFINAATDVLFPQIDSVREEIKHNYGSSESSAKLIREDRQR